MAAHRSDEPNGGKNRSRLISKRRDARQQSKPQARGKKSEESVPPVPAATLAAVLQSVNDGLMTFDGDWRCTYVNEAAAAFLKAEPAEIMGQVIWEVSPLLRNSRFHEGFLRAVTQKALVRIEDYDEPRRRWYECRCHPTESGLAVFLNDVTGHKKIEEAMLESRQVLEMAIAGSNAGIWRIDLNPEKPGYMPDYAYLSPQLKALIGFESDEFPNSRSAWQERVVPEDRPRLEEAARAHVEGRTHTYEVDFRIRHKDDTIRWLSSRGRLYRDELHRPIRWAGVDTDVTDHKAAEEAMRRLKDQAERAARQARWLARIPEESPHPVLRISNEHVLLYSNPAAERLCEYWSCWLGHKVPPVVQEIIADALAAGRATNYEILCGDRTFWLAVAPCPAEEYVNIHARDITERKRMERSLQEANERLQAQAEELQSANEELQVQQEELQSQTEELQKANAELQAQQEELQTQAEELRESEQALRQAHERAAWLARFPQENPNPVLRVSFAGEVLYCNPAAAGLPGWTCEVGAPLSQAVLRRLVGKAMAEGRAIEQEVELDGTPYAVAVAPIAAECYANVYGRDIIEQKRAEEEAKREHRRTSFANRVLRAFAECEGDELFDRALAVVQKEMASRQGVFGYIAEPGHLICPSLSKMLDSCEVEGKCIRYPPEKWKGLWVRALTEKRSLYANEAPPVPPGHPIVHNNLAAPILFQGEAIGLLNVANKEGGYSDEDRETLDAIAARVAPTLYAWIQRKLREDERAGAEQALRESEQRLRLALEAGRMGLWEWELDSGDCVWDQRVYELLGLDRSAKASHQRFLQHVDPRDIEAFQKRIQASPAECGDFQVEFRLVPLGGEARWVTSCGRTIRDASGKPLRQLGILYDITPRKQMEERLGRLNDQLEEEVQVQTEELRQTLERLQDEVVRRVLADGKLRKQGQMLEGFFQHTITPLAFMDRQFNFVQVNEAYAQADGKTPEFFKGKSHFELYPNEENQAIFEEVVRTGEPYRAFAKPFAYPDRPQQVTYWDWQLTPLRNDRDVVQFLVLNLQDVTPRQKAVDELEHRAFQLQKLTLELSQAEDRERRRMAEVLHDGLQQQLAAAKFHLGLLSSRAKSDAAMQEIAGQLDQMLRDAIEQSRSLSHELSPAVLYQSDLGETFEWLARQIQAKHGFTVHTEIHGQVDTPSESIKAFLFRTGQEILFNAVKHAQVTEARLRLQRRRDRLWLTIVDHGRGFDPAALGRTAGFGLLSIRERVGLLGGRMRIRSVPSKGSVFLVTVPDSQIAKDRGRGAEDPGQKAQGKVRRRAPSSDGPQLLRILLVDDHKVMREGLAALIGEQKDMEIVGQAGDGSEAVERARELQPDVIIMDVAMPVMPGDEATRRIKAELPQTQVVALSMFAEPGVREKMLDAGAAIYLPKTGPSEELLAAIRDLAP